MTNTDNKTITLELTREELVLIRRALNARAAAYYLTDEYNEKGLPYDELYEKLPRP